MIFHMIAVSYANHLRKKYGFMYAARWLRNYMTQRWPDNG